MRFVKSFRDFFDSRFPIERQIISLRPDHFQKLYEMARQLDVSRSPVHLDEDDLEFLKQFPPKYWARAKEQRYKAYFNLLKDLHAKREGMGFKDNAQKIKQAIVSQDWDSLRSLYPDDIIETLKTRYTPEYVERLNEREIDALAERIAFEHVKLQTDHIDAPEWMDFHFKKSNRSRDVETISARPFFNRLYHKLERTKGEPHLPDSGLTGAGQHGYEQAYPDDDEYRTRGMQFPDYDWSSKVIRNFLTHNMHRNFGDLPEGPDIKWMPVTGENGRVLTDLFAVEYHYRRLVADWFRRLESDPNHAFPSVDLLRKEARKRAKQDILKMAQQGKLKGPPIPGVAPDGQPIRLRPGAEEWIDKDDLSNMPQLDDLLEPNPVYLPHKQVFIRKKVGGREVTEQAWVPVVRTAHAFREVGSEESDYERDEEGKVRMVDGKPVLAISPDKLRGYEKQFVHVAPEEYVKNRHQAPGAFHFNQNTVGCIHISKDDPEYEDYYNAVFGDQPQVYYKGDGPFYEDVIKGILACQKKAACGGAKHFEKQFLLHSLNAFHQMIVMQMLQCLGDPALQVHWSEDGKKQTGKRRSWVTTKMANWMQQNYGQGPRWKRLYGDQSPSFDQTTRGKEGGQVTIADLLSQRTKDKRKTGEEEGGGPYYAPTGRGPGVRRRETGTFQFAYALPHIRQLLQDISGLNNAAARADDAAQKSQGFRGSADDLFNLLNDQIQDKAIVVNKIGELLQKFYIADGINEKEAKERTERELEAWVEAHKTSQELVAAFRQHPLVKQALEQMESDRLRAAQQPQAGERGGAMSEDEQIAIDNLHGLISSIEDRGSDLQSPQIKGMLLPQEGQEFSTYVMSLEEPVRKAVQKEINRLYGKEEPAEAPPAAAREIKKAPERPAAPTPTAAPAPAAQEAPATSWVDLYNQKRYVQVAQHPDFLANAHPENMRRLLGWLERNKGTLDPADYLAAKRSLEGALTQRGRFES